MFELTSKAFINKARIPDKFTGVGEDISPPLKWENAPVKTKSFVIIMDDPDVPLEIKADGMWNHCLLYNIPYDVHEFLEGEIRRDIQVKYPDIQFVNNSWGKKEYGGPLPPPGPIHRYFFKLYALNKVLELPSNATKEDLLSAMFKHILAKAELVGIYNQ